MKHSSLMRLFKSLDIIPKRAADRGERYEALVPNKGGLVYWNVSPGSNDLVGLPRVVTAQRSTHARSAKEILYCLGIEESRMEAGQGSE